ncbi:MAG TPA: ABC transporter permease, partial [Amycolatopsis sp.]|nr:ABC transporter permease [Amycolatopsis sp.]
TQQALLVAAIYRDLRSGADQQFWCSLRDLYRGKPLQDAPVYPVALVSRDDFIALAREGKAETPGNYIEMSVNANGLTTSSVVPVVDGLQRMRQQGPVEGAGFTSNLAGMADRGRLVSAALVGTVVPLAAAGALAGLVIAAAAGAFWVDRRRSELNVLSTRGVGPFALMGKAVLEVLGIVVLGTGAGWLTAWWLIGAVGPSPLVTPGSAGASVGGAAIAFLLTLTAIAVTSGRRTANLFDAPVRRIRSLPWEAVPLLAAVAMWFLLADRVDVGAGAAGTVARIPPRLVVVPILLIVGLAILAGRLIKHGLSRAPSMPMHRASLFLAWRRVVAAPVAAAILIGATAVPVALSVYATTVTGSVDRTLHAEAQLIVGSDVVLGLADPVAIPPELAGRAAFVERFDSARIGDTTVNVLGVDPATFARAAFWDQGLPGPSLDEAMARLNDPKPAGILSGLSASDTAKVSIRGISRQLSVTNVAQLPGKTSGYPLLLVRRDLVDELAGGSKHPQLWVRGDPDEIFQHWPAPEFRARRSARPRT